MQERRRQTIAIAATVALLSLDAGALPAPVGPSTTRVPEVRRAGDIDPDPNIFETTIVAEEATVDLDGNGLMAKVYTYGGTVPGPEIRVKVGDTVIVHFFNQLSEASGIHWHGVETNNASDGSPLTQNGVEPGGRFDYKFVAARPGVFKYHPHFAPTNPVFKGQYGSLIVTEDAEAQLSTLGVLPSTEQTHTLMLADTTVCKVPGQNDATTYPADPTLPWAGPGTFPGHSFRSTPEALCENPIDNEGELLATGPLAAGVVPNVQSPLDCQFPGHPGIIPCRVNEGQLVLANGRVPAPRVGSPDAAVGQPQVPGPLAAGASVLPVNAGEGVRLQISNIAIARYYRLQLTDQSGAQVPLFRVGGEGGLLDRVRLEGGTQGLLDTKYDTGEILIAPGNRADVVAAIPPAPVGDILTLWTRDYSRTGGGFARLPTVPVLHLEVVGAAPGPPYSIDETVALLADPRVDRPVEELEGLPTASLVDPSLLSDPRLGSANPEISLTALGPGIDGAPGFEGARGEPGLRAAARSAGDYTLIPPVASSRYARVGDLLQLRITNATRAHHPFHLHGFSFQPLRMLDQGGSTVRTYDYNEFVDTIDIPGRHSVDVRVRLHDRPMMDGTTLGGALGRWLFHCHIFSHATLGMVSELVVLPEAGKAETTTTLLAPEITFGENGVVTVTVGSTGGTPTGFVTLTLDGGAPVMQTLANGTATFTVPMPAAGSHTVNVSYSGDGTFGQSTITRPLTVNESYTLGMAEGAFGSTINSFLTILNPHALSAPVDLAFQSETGQEGLSTITVPPTTRVTIPVDTAGPLLARAGLPPSPVTGVSTTVTSTTGVPLVVEEATYFNAGTTFTGGHRVTGAPPGTLRYFAEGSEKMVDLGTGPVDFFDTYLLIGNDNSNPAAVTVRFLPEPPAAPVTHVATVPAHTRATIPIASAVPSLVGTSFGMVVSSDIPVSTTRSQYFGGPPSFVGAHASEGVGLPTTTHWFAEGTTNLGFNVFYAIANPNMATTAVTLTYTLDTGATVTQIVDVPGNGRVEVFANGADPALQAGVDFWTGVTSTLPVVVERVMYRPGAAPSAWLMAHSAPGTPQPSTKVGFAEGAVGLSVGFETFLMLANPSLTDTVAVDATYMRENGTTVVKSYTIPPNSRITVWVNAQVPELSDEGFGVVLGSTNDRPFIADQSVYWNGFSGGTSTRGTSLP